MSLYQLDLCWTSMELPSAEATLALMADQLINLNKVKSSFEAAVQNREQESPTGLPLAGRKVAVPHADPEHVLEPAIAVCALSRPVPFGEMGNPENRLPVEVIVMLALRDHQGMQDELVRIIERCQLPSFVDSLHEATSPEDLLALLRQGEQR